MRTLFMWICITTAFLVHFSWAVIPLLSLFAFIFIPCAVVFVIGLIFELLGRKA